MYNIFGDSARLNGAEDLEHAPAWLKQEAQCFLAGVCELIFFKPFCLKSIVKDLKVLGVLNF